MRSGTRQNIDEKYSLVKVYLPAVAEVSLECMTVISADYKTPLSELEENNELRDVRVRARDLERQIHRIRDQGRLQHAALNKKPQLFSQNLIS